MMEFSELTSSLAVLQPINKHGQTLFIRSTKLTANPNLNPNHNLIISVCRRQVDMM